MNKDAPMNLDAFIRAMSSRPGLPGLTPISRSENKGITATVFEQILHSLQEQESLVNP
ncbi:MAG: hypothetical protein KJO35_03270 [Gammaproteobacteria bacterium]|nr:hypothetical protein [Gammaproteobacteria bacterium]